MAEIQILPELLINKIAAGEVVERPASVVKELVENSIDAGADQIFVTIKNGGKDYISVLDNGKGMNPEDANLAIERHATSKIKEVEDLNSINTMGFRGEALAAISSVSRFEMITCCDESQGGYKIRMEGGKNLQQTKTGFPLGTRITIENLFFNTPARQKFMKATNTEYKHIYDLMLQLAMANPKVQFRLTHNQNIVLNIPKNQTFKERVRACFGDEIANDLIILEHKESYLSFYGLFSRPTKSRPNKRWQHIFVNGRYVKCPGISHGIYQGYKTLLMKNMHPVYFIKLQLNAGEIDVNVHPAKTEIRMKNQNLIHTILSEQVSRKLRDASRKTFFNNEVLGAKGVELPPNSQINKNEYSNQIFPESSFSGNRNSNSLDNEQPVTGSFSSQADEEKIDESRFEQDQAGMLDTGRAGSIEINTARSGSSETAVTQAETNDLTEPDEERELSDAELIRMKHFPSSKSGRRSGTFERRSQLPGSFDRSIPAKNNNSDQVIPNTNNQNKKVDSEKAVIKNSEKAEQNDFFVETSEQLGFSKPLDYKPKTFSDNKTEPEFKKEEENPFSFANNDEVKKSVKQQVLRSSQYRVIGQFHKTYIIAQTQGRLVLVDQHAAHERIQFEQIRRQFFDRELPAENLLIPIMMQLPPQDGLLLEQSQEYWEKLGFEIDHFGGNDYSIKRVPSILKQRDVESVIRQIIDEIAVFGKSGKIEVFYNEVFESMACHSAIRAGQELSFKEMQLLLDQLESFNIPLQCPHGRPVLIEMEVGELEKKFRRVL